MVSYDVMPLGEDVISSSGWGRPLFSDRRGRAASVGKGGSVEFRGSRSSVLLESAHMFPSPFLSPIHSQFMSRP